jgi:hypothetical protein
MQCFFKSASSYVWNPTDAFQSMFDLEEEAKA